MERHPESHQRVYRCYEQSLVRSNILRNLVLLEISNLFLVRFLGDMESNTPIMHIGSILSNLY